MRLLMFSYSFLTDKILCEPLKEMLSKAIFWNIGILQKGKVNVGKEIFIYKEGQKSCPMDWSENWLNFDAPMYPIL